MSWGHQLLDAVVKITQIVFYVSAGSVAILTYLKAKKTLLNSVNTEYNKHVIERLAEISEELFSEFEEASPDYWLKHNIVGDQFAMFSKQYEDFKKEFPKREPDIEWFAGVPVTKKHLSLVSFERKVRSDPFIPKRIRAEILEYLNGRLPVLLGAEQLSFGTIAEVQLHQDRPLDRSEGLFGIENSVNDFQYKRGFGISQCEDKVEAIRLTIQKHFETYDPLT